MSLSDDDRRRIEEEEYRKVVRAEAERAISERAERAAASKVVRLEADIRSTGENYVEVRGVSTEVYRDAKRAAKNTAIVTYVAGKKALNVLCGVLAVILGACTIVEVMTFAVSSYGVSGVVWVVIGCAGLLGLAILHYLFFKRMQNR